MRRLSIAAAFLGSAAAVVAQTSEHRLSAREIFYNVATPSERAAPATKAKKKPEVPKSPSSRPARPEPPAQQDTMEPSARTRPQSPGGVVPEYVTNTVSPLGLRYSILKRQDSGDYVEVSPDSTFHSGDRIRVILEANDTGYLYVVQQGSSDKWETLYPSPETNSGSNRVEPKQVYRVPPEGVFSFDTRTGTERLFIVLSRQPVSDLDSLIYSLDDSKRRPSSPGRQMLAQNIALQNDLVRKLRDVYSRDLLIEKVDDSQDAQAAERTAKRPESPSRPGEKAVYVVNPKAGANARVVADISLRHE
jgi:hypothetical protein